VWQGLRSLFPLSFFTTQHCNGRCVLVLNSRNNWREIRRSVCQHGDCAQICEWLWEVLLAKPGGASRVDRVSKTSQHAYEKPHQR